MQNMGFIQLKYAGTGSTLHGLDTWPKSILSLYDMFMHSNVCVMETKDAFLTYNAAIVELHHDMLNHFTMQLKYGSKISKDLCSVLTKIPSSV